MVDKLGATETCDDHRNAGALDDVSVAEREGPVLLRGDPGDASAHPLAAPPQRQHDNQPSHTEVMWGGAWGTLPRGRDSDGVSALWGRLAPNTANPLRLANM